MRVVTSHQMREVDRITSLDFGISSLLLMSFAGKSAADRISALVNNKRSSKIAVVCGQGNNGGDGFAAAILLRNSGFHVDVFYCEKSKDKLGSESRTFFDICAEYGIIKDPSADLSEYDIIIDSLLGIGVIGKVREDAAGMIRKINSSGKRIISIDMPSGLPADGPVENDSEIVRADVTLTMGLPKINLITYPGVSYSGEVQVLDIGFPLALLKKQEHSVRLFEEKKAKKKYRPLTDPDASKNSRGHVLIIGGFEGMEGAGIMAASALFETGCGLATLMTSHNSRNIIAGKIPELMTVAIDGNGTDSVEKEILSGKYNALLIGPGMGRSETSKKVFEKAIIAAEKSTIKFVIIDGDGLFHLSTSPLVFFDRQKIILTPHAGEAARLLRSTADGIKKDRLNSAVKISTEYNATVLMKGPRTITTNGKSCYINTSGNMSLATAGSGDVLSGIISSLIFSTETSLNAASLGAYIHGKSAEFHTIESEVPILKATDLIKNIKKVIAKFTS